MRDCRRQLSQVIEDDFVDSLQKSVQSIKKNRELEVHFMGWHEMLRDERAEDKAEGKAEDVLECCRNWERFLKNCILKSWVN